MQFRRLRVIQLLPLVWFPGTGLQLHRFGAVLTVSPLLLRPHECSSLQETPPLGQVPGLPCRLGHHLTSLPGGSHRWSCSMPSIIGHMGGLFRLYAAAHFVCVCAPCLVQGRCIGPGSCILVAGVTTMALGSPIPLPLAVLPLDRKGDPPLPSPPGGSLPMRPCPLPEAPKHLFCFGWAGQVMGHWL